jgi:SPP1 gp7 family putative phage head morphogenesis protein
VRPSHANELWYKAELLRLVRLLRQAARDYLVPAIKLDAFRGDAALPPTTASQLATMQRKFGSVQQTASRLASIAAQKNLHGVDDALIRRIQQSVGVDIRTVLTSDGIRDVLRDATQTNIDLIASIPTEYFDKLQSTLEKNWQAGGRWEDLAEQIERVGDVTETRAKIIARDQTAKMNSAFNKARQASIGIGKYIWQTSGDERVREEHAELDGEVCSWDNPPVIHGEPLNPGEDILCRCVAVPYFDLDEMEEEVS